MWKCCADKVLALVISLTAQYANDVQYNWAQYKWAQYLRREFFANCREAQEEIKPFHDAWLLLLIILVAWQLSEDNQFPPLNETLIEAVKFALLWQTKDVDRST